MALTLGCGEDATLLNPSFVNYAFGGVVPLTPGPDSGFVLARVVNNNTGHNIRFVVTAERRCTETDETGTQITRTETETVRLQTFPQGRANEVGILFDCQPTLQCMLSRVGLGENIDFPETDPSLYVDAVPGQAEGFGVPGFVSPLSLEAGNFACGDTLIFMASYEPGTVGNVSVASYRLANAEQPDQITGTNTFNNARTLIEDFTTEE